MATYIVKYSVLSCVYSSMAILALKTYPLILSIIFPFIPNSWHTVLRAIKELTVNNITYTSESGKSYDFNTADPMNKLLVKSLMATEELRRGQSYYLDFDHQFIETEKYDTKRTYKKFIGYSLGVAVINNVKK